MTVPLFRLPVLVVTPHSSGHAPLDVLSQMLGERAHDGHVREERLSRLFLEGDPYTDLIFFSARARMWHAGVSRFVVDFDFEREDSFPNGLIKHSDAWLRPLYPDGFELTPIEREERLRRYWDPYHEEIERSIVTHGVRLLVSGRAMHPIGPPLSRDEGLRRPALALLTGGGANGEALSARRVTVDPKRARALHHLAELHFGDVVAASDRVPHVIALNTPRSVDDVSARYSDPLRPLHLPAFGIEVNRALYLRRHGSQEHPDEGQLRALNSAFERFVRGAAQLFVPDEVA